MRGVGKEDLFWRDLGSRPGLGTTGFCLAIYGVGGGIHQCPVPSPTEAISEQERILQPTPGGKDQSQASKIHIGNFEFRHALRSQDLRSKKCRASVCSGCKWSSVGEG